MDSSWYDDDGDAVEEIGDALPIVLTRGETMGAAEADALFERVASRLSPLEAEGLGNALRSVGRWAGDRRVRGLAGGLLPLAGTAVGAVYGGPVGASIGGALGKTLGQAVAGGSGRTPAATRAAEPAAGAGAAPSSAPGAPSRDPGPSAAPGPDGRTDAAPTGSGAAAKLLYLVQNPAFVTSLASLALGSQGARAVGVGKTEVPVGAFVNAAASLLEEVMQDADELAVDTGSSADGYLRDDAGRLRVDPVVPSHRAEALLRALQQDEVESAALDVDGPGAL